MLMFFFSATMFTLVSCSESDDDTTTEEAEIREEEAAESLTLAISPQSNGMVEVSVQASLILEASFNVETGYAYVCNQEYTDSYNLDYNGAALSYTAAYDWAWKLNCADDSPANFVLNLNGISSYEGQRMNSDGTMNATLDISNLEESESNYAVSMSYMLDAEQVSKVRKQTSFDSTIKVDGDLSVAKESQQLTAGTVEVSFIGISATGNTYTYTGVVVFHGDDTATLTMQSGNTYEISW